MHYVFWQHGLTRRPAHPIFYGWGVLLALWLVYSSVPRPQLTARAFYLPKWYWKTAWTRLWRSMR